MHSLFFEVRCFGDGLILFGRRFIFPLTRQAQGSSLMGRRMADAESLSTGMADAESLSADRSAMVARGQVCAKRLQRGCKEVAIRGK